MFDYKHKVALITGGAAGIGLALAKELLRRNARAVALVDIDEENGLVAVNDIKAEFKRNDCVIFIKTDVSNKEQIKDAFDIVVNVYKQLDILVNNAATDTERNLEEGIAVNFTAVIVASILATETYFPKYRKGTESLIINMSSITAFIPIPAYPVYSATKSGVVLFTKAMGAEARYKDSKTRIIVFCPCRVDTRPIDISEIENNTSEELLSDLMKTASETETIGLNNFTNTLLDTAVSAPTGSIWTVTKAECKKVDYDRVLD